ncbi:ArsR family transcriptional regulator [Nocardioidaceae bacterium]|nr:ArsR family transcriptional regulator [Nocardioidaceae bacterium]
MTEREQPTRERVVSALLEHGPATAASLAERLDLTPAAVRRHLELLVDDGTLTTRDAAVRGTRGRGRPAREFLLTPSGRDALKPGYDDLAAQALRFLADTQGEEAVTAFARQRAAAIETSYARISDETDMAPTEAMARALSEHGYAASVQQGPAGQQLCQQHCPVAHVAGEFPQLCEAETEVIGRVLDRHVLRLATIAHGDAVCTTCIPDGRTTQRT